jgi:hypothetical protein
MRGSGKSERRKIRPPAKTEGHEGRPEGEGADARRGEDAPTSRVIARDLVHINLGATLPLRVSAKLMLVHAKVNNTSLHANDILHFQKQLLEFLALPILDRERGAQRWARARDLVLALLELRDRQELVLQAARKPQLQSDQHRSGWREREWTYDDRTRGAVPALGTVCVALGAVVLRATLRCGCVPAREATLRHIRQFLLALRTN